VEIYRPIPDPTPDPLLVNAKQAGRMLSVCERTIFNLVARGELTAIHIGKSVRFAVADLKAWVESAKDSGKTA